MVKFFGKGEGEGDFECAICKKRLPSREKLMEHEKTHLSEPAGDEAKKKKGKTEPRKGKKKNIPEEKKDKQKPKKPERIKLGIPGFDDMVEKGIPSGSSILLSGGPGSGKTIFCLQLANNFASMKKKCVYMSFEESVNRLKQHMKDFGWNPDKYIKDNMLAIKQFDPFEVVRLIEAMVEESKGELLIKTPPIKFIKDFRPEIVVVDSLSAVAAAFSGHDMSYRLYISQLFAYFKKMGVTSFIITETEEIPTEITRRGCEEFLADGVILLYNLKKTNIRISAMEILKIRGAKHQKRIVPIQIADEKGITVYPKQEVFEAIEA